VDLRRMGMGSGMGRWMQLTSGMHAVLLFFRLCDSVSLYGFSTYRCANPNPDRITTSRHSHRICVRANRRMRHAAAHPLSMIHTHHLRTDVERALGTWIHTAR
jgi:hypothetical protein